MNITLALGGVGVKGFAHVGSLRVLEAEGFYTHGVGRTSAGGSVKGFTTSGYSPNVWYSGKLDRVVISEIIIKGEVTAQKALADLNNAVSSHD